MHQRDTPSATTASASNGARRRTSRGHARTASATAAAALGLVVLTACSLQSTMTISPAGTYDVTLEMRDTSGQVLTSGTDCSQYAETSLIGSTHGAKVSATRIGSAGSKSGIGCRITVSGVKVGSSSDSSALVRREGDLDVVTIKAFDASGLAGTGVSASTAPTGSSDSAGDSSTATTSAGLDSLVSTDVSVTFPGAVVDGGTGKVAGRTVTWTSADALSDGVRATGYATAGRGMGLWQQHKDLILGGAAIAIAAGALAWVLRRRSHRPS